LGCALAGLVVAGSALMPIFLGERLVVLFAWLLAHMSLRAKRGNLVAVHVRLQWLRDCHVVPPRNDKWKSVLGIEADTGLVANACAV